MVDAVQNEDAELHYTEGDGQYYTKLNLKMYWLVCHASVIH